MFNKPTKEESITALKTCSMSDDLQNIANNAGQKVRSLYNSASNEITHASDVVTGEIRGNPIRSSAIALGLGVIIGALLRR